MANILVIDDQEDIRLTLELLLESHGHRVFGAPDGRLGTLLFEETPIDLIITDIFMPEQEGLETIFELKKRYPHIKIIAISGGGERGDFSYLKQAKKFGARETFEKPFEMDELLEAVDKLLKT